MKLERCIYLCQKKGDSCKNPGACLRERIISGLDSKADRLLADELGCSKQAIHEARKALGQTLQRFAYTPGRKSNGYHWPQKRIVK